MSLTKTRDELIQQALLSIGAILPGEAPAPEDYEVVDNLIDPMVAQLESESVYALQNADAIEMEAFLPIARILANTAGPHFGAAINDDAKKRDEAILRKVGSTRPTYEALRTDYF